MDRLALRTWVRTQTLITTAEISDTVLNSFLVQGLLDAASRYQWPWSYKSGTVAVAAGNPIAALPADFMFLDALFWDAQGRRPLKRTSALAVVEQYGDEVPEAALPDRYFRQGNNVVFVPTPSAALTLNVYYYATPDLTLFDIDTESPPFHSAFHIALAEYAEHLVWHHLEQHDKGNAVFDKYLNSLGRMATFYDSTLAPEPVIVGGGTLLHRLLPWSPYLEA